MREGVEREGERDSVFDIDVESVHSGWNWEYQLPAGFALPSLVGSCLTEAAAVRHSIRNYLLYTCCTLLYSIKLLHVSQMLYD